MFLVVAGLVALVAYLAHKAPASPPATQIPPVTSMPMLGATGNMSPATAGGSPMINRAYRLQVGVTYPLLTSAAPNLTSAVRTQLQAPQRTFIPTTATLSAAAHSLMTARPVPLVATAGRLPRAALVQPTPGQGSGQFATGQRRPGVIKIS